MALCQAFPNISIAVGRFQYADKSRFCKSLGLQVGKLGLLSSYTASFSRATALCFRLKHASTLTLD